MSQIEDAMDGLMTAIRNSEEFIRYQAIKERYMAFQNWKARSQNFVRKIICCRTVRELWICMKRQTAWRMSTGSFGRILWRQSILQQKMHSAKLCSRSTGL